MPDVIKSHDSISRSAVERYGGTVVKMTGGDGLFAVFCGPSSRAVLTVVDLQRDLIVAGSSSGVQLRVRCGVHVGEATQPGVPGLGEFGADEPRAQLVACLKRRRALVVSAAAEAA